MSIDGICEEHKQLQAATFKKLQERGYTNLQQNVPYRRKIDGVEYVGEIDIFGKSPTGFVHIYAIPSICSIASRICRNDKRCICEQRVC